MLFFPVYFAFLEQYYLQISFFQKKRLGVFELERVEGGAVRFRLAWAARARAAVEDAAKGPGLLGLVLSDTEIEFTLDS